MDAQIGNALTTEVWSIDHVHCCMLPSESDVLIGLSCINYMHERFIEHDDGLRNVKFTVSYCLSVDFFLEYFSMFCQSD